MSRLLRGVVPLVASACALAATLPACTSTANVGDVYTALDGGGARKRNIFYTDSKEIHCITELGIGRDGVTIEGLIRQQQRWDASRRQYVATNRVLASAEGSPERSQSMQLFDLQLTKEGPNGETGDDIPFLLGRYQCEIYLDGELKGSALFNIEEPPCPLATIRPGTVCSGFYVDGRTCPAYGSSSTDPATCTCDPNRGWSCSS